MTRFSKLTRRAAMVAGLAIVGCAGSSLAVAPSASATQQQYCAGWYTTLNQNCYGARHSLRSNLVLGYYAASDPILVGAAALDTGLNIYGSWVTGLGSVCHSYSGANLLHPWLKNASIRSGNIEGQMGYGTGAGPC